MLHTFTVTNMTKTNKTVPQTKWDIDKEDQLVNLWQQYRGLFNVSCKSYQISWNCHCEIVTTNSRCLVFGLDELSSVCVQRIIKLKNRLKLFLCLWSPTFLNQLRFDNHLLCSQLYRLFQKTKQVFYGSKIVKAHYYYWSSAFFNDCVDIKE